MPKLLFGPVDHRRSLLLLVTFLLLAGALTPAAAQEAPAQKYWIFLVDKVAAGGKTAAPAPGYVTAEAAARRARRGRAVPTHLDAPLSPTYLDALRGEGVAPLVESRWLNAVSAYLEPAEAERVERLGFVQAVRPVRALSGPPVPAGKADGVPDRLTDYGPSRRQLAAINAIAPLEAGINGHGVRLGFLDSDFGGFEHPVFDALRADGRLVGTADFTVGPQESRHGLAVASVAVGFEEGMLVGPGHGAQVLGAVTEYAPTETRVEEDQFVAGLEWLEAHGVDVVNVSLGYTTFDDPAESYTPADLDGDTAVTTRAVDRAAALGVVVVTSAGNEGGCDAPEDCWYYVSSPADADSAIAVAAVDPDSTRSWFSSHGPTADGRTKPDVAAPGTLVVVATPNGYGYSQGTSFAAPLVAGVVCQMLQVNPALGPIEVRDILRATASQADSADDALGWGVVNAAAAVERARLLATGTDPLPDRLEVAAPFPNPFRARTTFTVRSPEQVTGVRFEVYDLLGRRVAVPLSGDLPAGTTHVVFDGSGLAAGVYLYRLTGTGIAQSGTVVLAR